MAAAPVSYGIGVKNRYAFLDDTTDDGNIKLAHLNNTHIKSVQNNNLLVANNHQISKQQHHHQSNVNNKKHDVTSDQQLNSNQSNQSQQNTKKSHVNNNQSQKTINSQHQSIDFNKRTYNNAPAHDKINSNTNNKSHTSTPKGLQTINSGPLNNDNTANRKYQSSFSENKSQSGADNTNNNDIIPTKASAPKYRRRPENGNFGAKEECHQNQNLTNGTTTDDEKRRRQQKRVNDFKFRDFEKRDSRRHTNARPNQGDQNAVDVQEGKPTENGDRNDLPPRQVKTRENNRPKEGDWSPRQDRPTRGGRGRPPFAGRGRREDGERKDGAPEASSDAVKGPPDGRPPMRRGGGGRGGFGGRGGRGARMNGEERRPREDDRRHQKPIPNFKDNLMFPSLAP